MHSPPQETSAAPAIPAQNDRHVCWPIFSPAPHAHHLSICMCDGLCEPVVTDSVLGRLMVGELGSIQESVQSSTPRQALFLGKPLLCPLILCKKIHKGHISNPCTQVTSECKRPLPCAGLAPPNPISLLQSNQRPRPAPPPLVIPPSAPRISRLAVEVLGADTGVRRDAALDISR